MWASHAVENVHVNKLSTVQIEIAFLLFFHAFNTSTLNLSVVSLVSVYNKPVSVYAFMHSRSIYQPLFTVCV